MEEDEEERDKDAVPEKDILSQVGPFQVPQHHDIIPLSIIGCQFSRTESGKISVRLQVGWAKVSTRIC